MLPQQPRPSFDANSLDKCQGCGRWRSLVWGYVGGELQVACKLCFHVSRGNAAEKMLAFWKNNGLDPVWQSD